MASDPVSLRGVVIKSREFKERDRIITFLSAEMGTVEICVKGSGKNGSRFAACTVPFVVLDVVITATGTFWYLKDYSVVFSNSGIMSSLEAMMVGAQIGDLLSSAYIDRSGSRDFYELTVYTFYALSETPGSYLKIFSGFVWRFMSILGLNILYESCCKCGCDLHGSLDLSLKDGLIYCSSCFSRANLPPQDFAPLSHAGVMALNHFASADFKLLFSVNVDDVTLHQLYRFVTSYLEVQLDIRCDALMTLLKDLNEY